MKNKKLIFSAMLMILMLVAQVTALVMPFPVLGKVTINGVPQAGLQVSVNNLRTGDTGLTETNKYGEFQVEVANFPNQYRYGDQVYIKACEGDPMCTRTIVVEGGMARIDFPIIDMNVAVIFKGITVLAKDLVTAQAFWWFLGFLGLVAYWRKKSKERGEKMLETFFKKLKLGKYK